MATTLAEMIRSRWMQGIALAVVVLSLVLPGEGLVGWGGKPLPLCYFKTSTGLPCPGCGLTRGFIRMAHLQVREAVVYNPVTLVLFPLTVFLALLLAVGTERRERMARWVERRGPLFNSLAVLVLVVFLVNGAGRIVWLLRTHPPSSPW